MTQDFGTPGARTERVSQSGRLVNEPPRLSDGPDAFPAVADATTPAFPPPPAHVPTVASQAASGSNGSDGSTTDVAKEQAGEVAASAKDAGQQVAQTAKEQVGEVTAEAGRQARQLAEQVRSEVTDQAATQQQRVAGGIRSLADELQSMSSGSDQDGPATDLARQAAHRMHAVAQWLEDREPGSVLEEVRSFARRRPGAYLAVAVGAGVLAGRLTRGLTADQGDASASSAVRPKGSPNGSASPASGRLSPSTGVEPDPFATASPALDVPPMPGTGTVIVGARRDLTP